MGSQVLTCGSDRKIAYWDTMDAQEIRILLGSDEGKSGAELSTVAIQDDGERFVSSGGDALVKLWSYDEGECIGVGAGHSLRVNAVKIAPNQSRCVSVGDEGAIFIWELPQ